MRLVCISDTHKRHKEVEVPDGDMLIFAGDMCGGGSEKSARKFARWFGSHPHKHKISVAGNHDKCFEHGSRLLVKSYFNELGLIYLEHEPERVEGLKFFGSPYQPEFCTWAFNLPRGEALARKWGQIPDDTEVLITHSPPHGILDYVEDGRHYGCEDLRDRIDRLGNLRLHVFGHIHFAYGSVVDGNNVTFVNACICDEDYNATNKPIVVDI